MADVLFVHGSVLTLDPLNTVHSALALRNGRIQAVGEAGDLQRLAHPDTEIIDLGGRTICPGFIDGHNHFSIASFEPRQVNCSTPPLANLPEVLEAIRAQAARELPGQWVRGWGFHSSRVPEQRNPSRWELDEVCPHSPFVLMDMSYHACHVNSRALELAGITRLSPDPPGGEIVRDAHGEPTGTLLEAAMDIPQALSWLSFIERSPDDATALVEQNCRTHLAVGITGVGDALVVPEAVDLYRRAAERDRLLLTMHQMHGGDTFFAKPRPGAKRVDMRADYGRMLRGGMLKMFMDKVYDKVFAPANMDHCDHGVPVSRVENLYYSARETEDLVLAAAAQGLDVAIHCMGSTAIDQTLAAFSAQRRTAPTAQTRLRIEHWIVGSPQQARRTGELGAVVMAQPGCFYNLGDIYLQFRAGQPDLKIMPLRSLLDAGVIVAASSDYPCGDLPPAQGIWGAVVRRTSEGVPVDVDEAVTPLEALRMYTSAAAYACGRESEEGTLEVGKRANLVVLDRNPLSCPVESLREMTVLQTYVDGKRLFVRAEAL